MKIPRYKEIGGLGNGVQMYQCKACNRKFTVLTGTVFDGHKITISEWIEYLYNLFSYISLRVDSWNNTRFWLEKMFILIQEYQKGIVLEWDLPASVPPLSLTIKLGNSLL